MAKQPTEKQLAARRAFAEQARARAAAAKAGKPQTNTSQNQSQPSAPVTPLQSANPQLVTLTADQFEALLARLQTGSVQDKTPAPSMTAGVGLQTNPFGQVVGTVTKFNIDPAYYPNPLEDILDEFELDRRMRRFNLRENYFITWDITSKPYQTKDNLSVQEPTFHLTLYANDYDDQGDDTGRAIVIQTLHMNEDQELAANFAAEQGIEVTDEGLRQLMDATRYERTKRWLLDVFFPPRNFELTQDAREEAIGGQVVKVVTKSNVKGFGNKTPVIADEELQ